MNRTKDLKKKRGSKRLPYFLPFCLFLLFLSLTINPRMNISIAEEAKETDERIVTGTGIIVGENIALARNEAISKASLKAVEEYLIQRLGYQGVANNFESLDEEILSRPKEEIRDYQIISEFRTDTYVKVLMKVRVNKAVLEQKLQNMGLSETGSIQIAVLFLVSEKREGFPIIYWWGDPSRQTALTQTELSLSRVFEERNLRVISRSFFPSEESYDESMLDLTLGNEEAAKWGKLLSAQVVIVGETNQYEASRASVFLRAINVMDGTVIVQGYREGILDSNQREDKSAIELAINSWAHDMISDIINAFKPAQNVINRIIVMIKGLKTYREFRDFKEFLRKDFPEIRSVLDRSLKRDLVKVAVEVEGGSKRLAEKVRSHPKKPLSFEINEVSDQGFTVVLR
ncbi:MAG: hypothetical protein ACETWD_03110 [Desulfatiglandales bacterium]